MTRRDTVAMLALTLISLAGMSASVLVVESTRGSASAINIAGSLRRYTHRVANLIAVDALSGRVETARVAAAVLDAGDAIAAEDRDRAGEQDQVDAVFNSCITECFYYIIRIVFVAQ